MNGHTYPVKVLQFGDGVFLRGFIDWMVQEMQTKAGFDGSVAVVKARSGSFDPAYASQNLRYTLVSKGIRDGKAGILRETIGSLSKLLNPYENFEDFLKEAGNPELLVVVSNTTEAGISESPGDRAQDKPAQSFPGKLCQLLRRRYEVLGAGPGTGLIIMPCELIEKNGQQLRGIVLGHARRWFSDPAFESWIERDNYFVDTLVDRIVSGFQDEERLVVLSETGFDDKLLAVAEPYHFLAIQGPAELEKRLPFRKAGLNVVWADDIAPYRLRKVRMLNGSHTFVAMCGLSMGLRTVEDCMNHNGLLTALEYLQHKEVLPFFATGSAAAGSPEAGTELKAYVRSVFERFRNPYLNHKLDGIAVNTCSKWKARLGGALADYRAATGKFPVLISFSLAAFFHKYLEAKDLKDEAGVTAVFASVSRVAGSQPAMAARMLIGDEHLWGQSSIMHELSKSKEFVELIGRQLSEIQNVGMERALAQNLRIAAGETPAVL